jgi:hypothetical protein
MAAWSNNHFSRSDQFYDELSVNSLYSGSDGQLRQVIDPTMIRKNTLLRSSVMVKKRQEESKTSHPWVEDPGRPSSTRGPSSRSKSPYNNRPKSISGAVDSCGRTTRIEGHNTDKKEKKRSIRSGVQIHPSNHQSCHGHLCYDSGGSVFDEDEEDKLSKSSRNSTLSKNSFVHTNSKHSKTKFSSTTTVQSVAALSVAAIAGGLILGPVGVLLGTGALACAGIYHSLPEEQRQQIFEDTDRTCKKTYEWGERMSDRLGASCATVFEKTGDLVGCDTPPTAKRGSRPTSFGALPTPKLLSSRFKNALNKEVVSDGNEGSESEGRRDDATTTSNFADGEMKLDGNKTPALNKKIESNEHRSDERQSKTINHRHDQQSQRTRSVQQQSPTPTTRGKMLVMWALLQCFVVDRSII